jgi:predicted MFS family arabinose efflux permease
MIFKDKDFVTFWVGSFVSSLGDAMFLVGLSWMVVRMTGSATILGLLLGAMSLPQILFSVLGGALVDRLDPKRFMMASDAVRLVAMVFLVGVSSQGLSPVWALFVVAVVFGTADAGFWPAALAFQQSLVSPDQYVQANGLVMIASQTTQIAGPALAGLAMATGNFSLILVLNAVTYGISLGCLARVTRGRSASTPLTAEASSSLRRDIAQGVHYMLQTPVLLVTSLAAFVVNACLTAVILALPLLAHQLQWGSRGFGFMTAALGLGGAVGAIAFTFVRLRRPTPRMTLAATGLEGLLFIAIGLTHQFVLLLVVLCGVGILEVAVNTIAPSVNQQIIPPAMFGREISLTIVVMDGAVPLARAASGWSIAHLGLWPVLWGAGVLELVASTIAFMLPVIRLYSEKIP